MNSFLQINDESFHLNDFIHFLHFSGEFEALADRFIRNRVIIQAAKEKGITADDTEIQQEADDFRRCMKLHRVSDTQRWLESKNMTVDDFEKYITEMILFKKITKEVITQEEMNKYFRMHSPKFDTADIFHIIIEGENKAIEMMAMLEDEPENFSAYARKYSMDEETRSSGGFLPDICREVMPETIEAKIFNAGKGEIIGPFTSNGSGIYEIIKVSEVYKANMEDEKTRKRVAEAIHNEWLETHLKSKKIELFHYADA